MSDALRPSSLFTSAAPATAPSGVLATLPNPPPEVSQLAAGTTVRGTVVGHDDRGHLLVRTDLGTLAVSTKVNLPPGSDVVLQIRSSGAQLHVLLMHSEFAAGGGGSRAATPPLSGSGAPIPDRLTLGHNIHAILQAPAAGGGVLDPALATALARLAPGSPITLRITAVDVPPGVPAGAPGSPSGPSPLATTPAGAATSAPPGAPVPAGGQTAAATGQPASPSVPAPGAAPQVSGVPSGGTPAGTPGIAAGPLSAPPPPTSASGPTQAQPPVAQGSAPTPGTNASSPGPAPTTAPPGANAASGTTAPPAPPTTHALPPSLRSAATAAGAAYGAAVQQHPGPVPPLAATAGSAAANSSQSVSTQNAAPANSPVSPGLGPTAPGANSAAPPLVGVVTATTKAGHPVLQTPIGTMTLEVRTALPVGSRVVFEVLPQSLPQGAAGVPFESEALPSSLARAWPEVEEAVRVLHESALPGASGGPGTPVIPQPGVRLASGLLFFLAALSGGDVNRWLGERGVQALKDAGRGSLLVRLGQDFGQLSRLVESGGGDWRLFLIPMLDGNQVQQIRFFERHGAHKRGGRDDGPDGDSTRFILEVELTRLGDMQLDGLVRERRFDLMLRTHRPLPEVMRHKITEIFNDANDAAGYIGNIGFQASREWRFMPVAREVAASAGAGLVI